MSEDPFAAIRAKQEALKQQRHDEEEAEKKAQEDAAQAQQEAEEAEAKAKEERKKAKKAERKQKKEEEKFRPSRELFGDPESDDYNIRCPNGHLLQKQQYEGSSGGECRCDICFNSVTTAYQTAPPATSESAESPPPSAVEDNSERQDGGVVYFWVSGQGLVVCKNCLSMSHKPIPFLQAAKHCELGKTLLDNEEFEQAVIEFQASLQIREDLLASKPNIPPEIYIHCALDAEMVAKAQYMAGDAKAALASMGLAKSHFAKAMDGMQETYNVYTLGLQLHNEYTLLQEEVGEVLPEPPPLKGNVSSWRRRSSIHGNIIHLQGDNSGGSSDSSERNTSDLLEQSVSHHLSNSRASLMLDRSSGSHSNNLQKDAASALLTRTPNSLKEEEDEDQEEETLPSPAAAAPAPAPPSAEPANGQEKEEEEEEEAPTPASPPTQPTSDGEKEAPAPEPISGQGEEEVDKVEEEASVPAAPEPTDQ